jgi:predicted transcriptional regulator
MKPNTRKRGPGEHSKELRESIYDVIHAEWPTYPTEIAQKLELSPKTNKKDLLLVKYHVDQLAKEGRIRVKKIDRAMVVWTADMERLRVIHELIKE